MRHEGKKIVMQSWKLNIYFLTKLLKYSKKTFSFGSLDFQEVSPCNKELFFIIVVIGELLYWLEC